VLRQTCADKSRAMRTPASRAAIVDESAFLAEQLVRLLEDFSSPMQTHIESAKAVATSRPDLLSACARVPRTVLACEVLWQLIADPVTRPFAATMDARLKRTPSDAHKQLECASCGGDHSMLHENMCATEQEPYDAVFLAAALSAVEGNARSLLFTSCTLGPFGGMSEMFESCSDVMHEYVRLNTEAALKSSQGALPLQPALPLTSRAKRWSVEYTARLHDLHSLAVMSRLQGWRDARDVSLVPSVRGEVDTWWWRAVATDDERLTQFMRDAWRTLYRTCAWLLVGADAASLRQYIARCVQRHILNLAHMQKLVAPVTCSS
jgi:hypothetical protein